MNPSGPPDDRPSDSIGPAPNQSLQDADRARALLAITNAVVSNLSREALFPAIASALHQVIQFDRSTIFLYDEEKSVLRLVSTENGVPAGEFVQGMELGLDSSHAGWAFVNQRPFYNPNLEKHRTSRGEEILFSEGFRSLIVLPLIVRGKSIGTLNLGSVDPMRFEGAEAELLQDVASQLALALENMRVYEEISRLNTQLQRENIHLREMLEARRDLLSQLAPTDVSEPRPAVVAEPITPAAAALPTAPVMGSATLEDVERAHILAVLAQTGWVIEGPRGAAKILDVHPNTLRSRMKRLGLERSRHGILPPPIAGV